LTDARSPQFLTKTDGNVCCDLCPKKCLIKSGYFGSCKVRGNKGGRGIIPFYGFISAFALDPIEKKPLYHYKPGTQILSLGFAGCNLSCPFCQNWHISQNNDIKGKWMKPGEVVSAALRQDNPSISYTYSEPLVHVEYVLDCMSLAQKHGITNVLVTNGCINEAAAAEILKLADAANIDLKSFSSDIYQKVLGGSSGNFLEAVLDFIRLAKTLNVHIEITTLVVPGLNDSKDELSAISDFIAALDDKIPWHLSAYHPDFRWNAPPTDPDFLLLSAKEARKKLRYVYTGNIPCEENDTLCSRCGAVLIRRRSYRTALTGLIVKEKMYNCEKCGESFCIA
jgi:pyruvate formate lyase activating enzyme